MNTFPRPSRQTLVALLTSLWNILYGGIRIFAWDSLKGGFIDIRPLPRVARLLASIGLVVVFLFIGSIFFNDALRFSGTLELLPLASSSTHGIFVPSLVVPLSWLASILAWTFLVTGALHVHVVVRWLVLACYLALGVTAGAAIVFTQSNLANLILLESPLTLVFAGVLVLIVSFLVLPRFRLPLALEFVWILLLVGGLALVNFYAAIAPSRVSGSNLFTNYLVPEAVTYPGYLVLPLIYLSGAEMVGFGISFAGWGASSVQRYARPWIVIVLLVGLVGYRWFSFFADSVLPGIAPNQIQQWLGALLAGGVLIPVALWRARHAVADRVPLKVLMGFILSMTVPQLVIFLVINVYSVVLITTATAAGNPDLVSRGIAPFQTLSTILRDGLYLQLALSGAVVAFFAVRRKRYTVAAFGIIIAWTQFVWWFMENGRPLQEWRYQYSDLEPWLLLALTAVTVYWSVRRQLTPNRALALAGLVFFAWVLNFTDFLDNPLALFFGFAGVFFTAFGILWGVLTAGGKFANYTSVRFPRLNRIVLYLGYVLLTLNVTHWYTVTHNVESQAFNNDINFIGLRIFGYAAAYIVFIEGGRALLKREPD